MRIKPLIEEIEEEQKESSSQIIEDTMDEIDNNVDDFTSSESSEFQKKPKKLKTIQKQATEILQDAANILHSYKPKEKENDDFINFGK